MAAEGTVAAVAESIGISLGLDVADRTVPPLLFDFARTAWMSVALLLVRVACERLFIPLLSSSLGRKKAEAIFDDAFIAFFCFLLEAQAVGSTLFFNGGCTPWATDACLVGWNTPAGHTLNIFQRLYFLFMFQYYLYEMLGTALGVGTVLKTDMVIHHIAAMCLISLGYVANLVRFGTMWMALFDLSNPLLHTAKVMHAAQVPVLKDVMLPLFALVFFTARLLAPPYSILRPAFTRAVYILPLVYAVIFIGLMIFVCILQVFWFYKIVQIARRGDKGSKDGKLE